MLTESAEGETPLIPDAIMKLSLRSAGATHIPTTLQVLSSPSQGLGGGAEASTDPVVRYAPTRVVIFLVDDEAMKYKQRAIQEFVILLFHILDINFVM